jgi:hypothetical protein
MPNPTAIPPFSNPKSADPLIRHPRHPLAYLRYVAGERPSPPPAAHDTPSDQARDEERPVEALVRKAASA